MSEYNWASDIVIFGRKEEMHVCVSRRLCSISANVGNAQVSFWPDELRELIPLLQDALRYLEEQDG